MGKICSVHIIKIPSRRRLGDIVITVVQVKQSASDTCSDYQSPFKACLCFRRVIKAKLEPWAWEENMLGKMIIYWDERFLLGFEQYFFRKNYHFSVDFAHFEYWKYTNKSLHGSFFGDAIILKEVLIAQRPWERVPTINLAKFLFQSCG